MTPSLDFGMIEMLRGFSEAGQPDPIIEIRSLFIEDAGRHLVDLHLAVTAGDERTARRTAHCLRGMSGSIGAVHMCELTEAFEKAPILDRTQISELEQEFLRVSQALLAA